MIRKSGWLIFLSILGALFLLIYVFAGTAIRFGMVYSLEKAAGAEVNIRKVSLGLFPLSLTIDDLQVTDAKAPEQNLVSFGRANAELELWPALLGYYVISDLSVEQLAYGSERRRPGKVFRGELAESKDSGFDFASLFAIELPDADELLARANLTSVAKGEALKQLAQSEQQQVRQLREQLPDSDRLRELEQQIKALIDGDIRDAADLAAKTEQLRRLKDELEQDKAKVEQVKTALLQSREQLQSAVRDFQQATQADWQQVQSYANLADGGLAGISQLLLGDLWTERLQQLYTVYQLVAPYLPEGSRLEEQPEPMELPGRILPLKQQPYPNFWIKNASISMLIGGGSAELRVQDITAQHQIIDAATRFVLDVQQLPMLQQFRLDGNFAIFDQLQSEVNWQLQGLQLAERVFGEGATRFGLEHALLNSGGGLNLSGTALSQQATVALQGPRFNSGDNRYVQQLTQLMNQQSEIPFQLRADGTVTRPNVRVSSPLDRIVADAVMGEAQARFAGFEQDLRSKFNAKLPDTAGDQQALLSLLDREQASTEQMSQQIETLLQAQLGDLRDRALDRIRGRIGG
ncbi:TIGR03545 family protein [Alkalimonas sp. NCh-2]|uniref:TIGR03545 family protein n=1 Tax=Alkalimonas sp. NCh-2 TaxID=3144846 RepID=UPI0031F64D6C